MFSNIVRESEDTHRHVYYTYRLSSSPFWQGTYTARRTRLPSKQLQIDQEGSRHRRRSYWFNGRLHPILTTSQYLR